MAVRNVAKNFTLEQQRQQVNLIGADLGDISSLNTPLPNTLARAINYLDGTVSSYEGTVWYVSTNGVDSIDNDPTSAGYRKNPGRTRNVAFRTVKYALSQASFGDTIHIGPGTFQEIFPLTIPAGVTVKGTTIRSTKIVPTPATNTKDCFLLNGDTGVEDLTVGDMFFNPLLNTGWAFRFATNSTTLQRSPYLQRITVLNKGSVTSSSDPYGFASGDAGCGILVDGSVVQYTTLEPAILCNEVTLICPNATSLRMTNGARVEWINCFSYFAQYGILAESGTLGLANQGKTRLRLSGVTGSIAAGNIIKYYDVSGNLVASGTIDSTATGNYVILTNKGTGIFSDPADRTAKVATVINNAALSTAQYKFGTASLYLPGTSDYITYASSPDFEYGTGDFTVDFWVRRNVNNVDQVLFDQRTVAGDTQPVIYISGNVVRYYTTGADKIVGTTTLSTNTWYHIALSRKSNTTRLFVNGTLQGSPYTDNNTYPQSTVNIGANFNGLYGLTGYIDELRISQGIGRYDTTFTPASFAYASDTFATLMLHFDGSNNSKIIVDDSVAVQDIRIRNAGDTSTVATASRIILADYQQFGAEMRSISSAVEFGTYGVKADGVGTRLRLISFNLNFVGSGKDFSQDQSNTIKANEIIKVNGGDISYVTIDQRGNVKIGDVFEVDQKQGTLNFGSQAFSISSLSNLTVTDNVTSTVITPTNITVGNLDFNNNNIETTTGGITLSPAGSNSVTIDSDLYVTGSYNVIGNINTNGDITFGSLGDLSTVTVIGQFNADNLRIDGNVLSSTDTNGNITLTPNGTGVVETVNDVNLGTLADESILTVIGQTNLDNLRVDGNTVSSTNTNGNIIIDPNGTGNFQFTGGASQSFVINDGTTPTPVNKFTVATTSGNTVTEGTLTVKGGTVDTSAVATNVSIINNNATAFTFKQGANSYVTLNTTSGSESITLHKNTNINGNLIVDGDITFRAGNGSTGSITLGDANTDSITFNAEVSSNVLPLTTNTYDLGSTSLKWKDIWAASNIYAGNIRTTGNTISSTNTNGNIVFDPNGTGSVVITGGASQNFTVNDGTTTKFNVLSTSGDTTISGFVNVSGNATISGGTVDVSAVATNIPIITNNASALTVKQGANSYITVNTTTGSESITLHKNTLVNGTLTVDGDITFRAGSSTPGTITLGDLNTDNIVFNADVNSSFIPDLNNTYDLGSSSQKWRTVYAGTSGYFANLLLDTNVISSTNTNGNITIDPNGTGSFIYKGGASQNFTINDGAGTPVTKFNVLSTTGDTTISGFINVSGNATVSGGTVDVSAVATNVGIITNNASAFTIKQGSNSYVTLNSTTGTESITLHKDTTFSTNVTITSNLTVNGNTTIGDATSDTVTVNARVASDFVPSTTGTRDFGTATLKWKDLYLSGGAYIGNLNVDVTDNTIASTNTNGNIILDPNGTGNLQFTGGASQNFVINDGTTTKFNVLSSSGDTTISGNATISGGTVNVSAAATTLSIINNNASSFAIKEGSNAYVTVTTTTGSEAITVTKNTTFNGTLTVDGSVNFKGGAGGTLTFGDATADTSIFNSYIGSSFIPSSSAAYDFGSATNKWSNLYLSTKAFIGNIGLTANTISTENANGDITIDPNGTGDFIFKGGTSQDFFINDGAGTPVNKFTVASTTGNTVISGTLTVQGGTVDTSAAATSLTILNNNASSFVIKESTNPYITLSTSTGAESITLHKNTTVSGNLTVNGDITFRAGQGTGGTITFGDLNTDNIVFNADINSTIIPDVTATYDIGTSSQKWRDIYLSRKAYIGNLGLTTNTLSTENTNGNLFLTPNGTGYVQISGTNAMLLPAGLTSQQPTGVAGMVRFNTTGLYFEGYNGTAWGSLGGVRSVDNQTYIIPERSPNESNNTLEFYTGGVQRMTLGRTAPTDVNSPLSLEISNTIPIVRINSTSNATDTLTGALYVAGGAGIVKDVYIGGTLTVAGNTLISGTTTTTGTNKFGVLYATSTATSLYDLITLSGTSGNNYFLSTDDLSLIGVGYRFVSASIPSTTYITSIISGYIATVTTSSADPARTAGVYSVTNLSGSASGVGAAFTITIDATGAASTVVVDDGGASFAVNETITVPVASIGATGSDLTLTVATITQKINISSTLSTGVTGNLTTYDPLRVNVVSAVGISNGNDVESNTSFTSIPSGTTVSGINGTVITLSNYTNTFISAEELTFANIADVSVFGTFTADYLNINSTTITGTKTNSDIIIAANGTGKLVTYNDVNFGKTSDESILTVIGETNLDNFNFNGNTILATNTNGSITLSPNGTGKLNITKSTDISGTVTITGTTNLDNLRVATNTISSTNTNGNIILSPNGTGKVTTINNVDIGTVANNSTLTVTGTLIANTFTLGTSTLSTSGDMTIQAGTGNTITHASLEQFNANTTFGNISTPLDVTVTVNGDLQADNINLNGNTITTTNTNGDLTIYANGTGGVNIETLKVTDNQITSSNSTIIIDPAAVGDATGLLQVKGDLKVDGNTLLGIATFSNLQAGNINIVANTISSTNTNGDIILDANGTGKIITVDDVSFGNSGDLSSLVVVGDTTVDNIFLNANDITSTNSLGINVENLRIIGNALQSVVANSDIVITPNGSGKTTTTKDVSISANLTVTSTSSLGNLSINTNTISSTNTNGNIILSANGTGKVTTLNSVDIGSGVTSATLTVTGTLNANNLRMTGSTLASIDATGVIVETLKITGNVLSSTTTNGDIVITPNGTGKTTTTKDVSISANLTTTGTSTLGNIAINTNTISSTNTNGNIILSPNGTGKVTTINAVDIGTGPNNSTLTVTGTLNANNLRMTGSTLTSIDTTGVIIETLKINTNVLSSTTANGDIVLTPNGTGKTTTTKDVSISANLTVTSTSTLGNIAVNTNTISSTNTNGNIILSPNGTGKTTTINAVDIGTSVNNSTLTVTGTLNANNLRMTGSTLASIDTTGVIVETLKITGNVLSSVGSNANIVLTPNGTGSTTTAKNFNVTNATLTVTGQFNADNLRITSNTLSSTNTNGNITFLANGNGVVETFNDVNFGKLTDESVLTVVGNFYADNININGNTITNTDTNGDITITGNGTGGVTIEEIRIVSNQITSANSLIVLDPGVVGNNTGDVQIKGNLIIDGTTTTLNSTVVTVDDINIELGSIDTPTDATANGGGITLKASSNKTITWSAASNYWTTNVGLEVQGDLKVDGGTLYHDATNNKLTVNNLEFTTNAIKSNSGDLNYNVNDTSSDFVFNGSLTGNNAIVARTSDYTQTIGLDIASGDLNSIGDLYSKNSKVLKGITLSGNQLIQDTSYVSNSFGVLVRLTTSDINVAQVANGTYNNRVVNGGSGSGGRVNLIVSGGKLLPSNIVIAQGGSGYAIGDSVTATFGNQTINFTVTDVSGSGINIKPSTNGIVKIDTNTGLRVPLGSEAQRPSTEVVTGLIRFNTSRTLFEGYDGSQWGSIGGVRDVDGNTYLLAETSPGANENIFYFYNNGTNSVQLSGTVLELETVRTISNKFSASKKYDLVFSQDGSNYSVLTLNGDTVTMNSTRTAGNLLTINNYNSSPIVELQNTNLSLSQGIFKVDFTTTPILSTTTSNIALNVNGVSFLRFTKQGSSLGAIEIDYSNDGSFETFVDNTGTFVNLKEFTLKSEVSLTFTTDVTIPIFTTSEYRSAKVLIQTSSNGGDYEITEVTCIVDDSNNAYFSESNDVFTSQKIVEYSMAVTAGVLNITVSKVPGYTGTATQFTSKISKTSIRK